MWDVDKNQTTMNRKRLKRLVHVFLSFQISFQGEKESLGILEEIGFVSP